MSVVDESLNYEQNKHTYGTYQLTKVIQQTGNQTVVVSNGGGESSTFDIPPKVGNFSKSIASFTVAPAIGCATGSFLLANTDGIPSIRQIQLTTRSGLYVTDIADFDKFSNMTMQRANMSSDVLGWDTPGAGLLVDTATSSFAGLIPGSAAPPAAFGVNLRYDGTQTTSLLEFKYFIVGAAGVTLAPPALGTLSPAYNVSLLFETLPDCFLGQKADSYFGGEIMNLRIV